MFSDSTFAVIIASVALILSLAALFRRTTVHHHEESYFMPGVYVGEESRSLGRRRRCEEEDFDAGEIEDDPDWMMRGR